MKLLNLMPTSTASNYQVRFGTPTRIVNDDQALLRGDHQFSSGNRISMRYFYIRSEDTPTILPNNVLYATDGVTGSSHSITLNHTYTFSPKWLNNFTASLTTSQPARLTAAPSTTTPPSTARPRSRRR